MVSFSMGEEFPDGPDASHLPHASLEHEHLFGATGKHFSNSGGLPKLLMLPPLQNHMMECSCYGHPLGQAVHTTI